MMCGRDSLEFRTISLGTFPLANSNPYPFRSLATYVIIIGIDDTKKEHERWDSGAGGGVHDCTPLPNASNEIGSNTLFW